MDILNIGLNRPDGGRVDVRAVLAYLVGARVRYVSAGVHDSDTEPTLVLVVDFMPDGRAHALAERFGQDCIAVYHCDIGRGRLAGPRADAWGQFEPDYFIMPDGARLVSHAAAYSLESERAHGITGA